VDRVESIRRTDAGPIRRKGVEAMTRVRALVLLVTLASFVAAFGAGFADGR
jgi:hypothetical protein